MHDPVPETSIDRFDFLTAFVRFIQEIVPIIQRGKNAQGIRLRNHSLAREKFLGRQAIEVFLIARSRLRWETSWFRSPLFEEFRVSHWS